MKDGILFGELFSALYAILNVARAESRAGTLDINASFTRLKCYWFPPLGTEL